MTDAELYALEAAAKAATPGPWNNHNTDKVWVMATKDKKAICRAGFARAAWTNAVNAVYIAAANPATILELIAELRQARADRDNLEELLNDYIGGKAELDALKLKDAEAERDWLADYIATLTGKKSYNTKEHWIKAARDAVNNNPQPHPQYSYEL